MILKVISLVSAVICLQRADGASYSSVYVRNGGEDVVPVEYINYGAPAVLAEPQIARLSTPGLGPIVSVPGAVPCVFPCVVSGQNFAPVAPLPNAKFITYNAPSGPVVVAPSEDNGYEYSYVVYDENTGDKKAQREFSDGSVVRGEYSFVQPDGYVREVQYRADDLTGFKVVVKNVLPESVGVAVQKKLDKSDPPPCKDVKSEALKVTPEPLSKPVPTELVPVHDHSHDHNGNENHPYEDHVHYASDGHDHNDHSHDLDEPAPEVEIVVPASKEPTHEPVHEAPAPEQALETENIVKPEPGAILRDVPEGTHAEIVVPDAPAKEVSVPILLPEKPEPVVVPEVSVPVVVPEGSVPVVVPKVSVPVVVPERLVPVVVPEVSVPVVVPEGSAPVVVPKESVPVVVPEIAPSGLTVSYEDIIRCIQSRAQGQQGLNLSPLTYIILPAANRPC